MYAIYLLFRPVKVLDAKNKSPRLQLALIGDQSKGMRIYVEA